jgi:AraC-like DNA-binding protein
MSTACPKTDSKINLEAPGDLLSGLLALCELRSEALNPGDVRTFPASPGQWRLLTPLSGSLDLAWEDQTWTLDAHQAAAFPGSEGLSLLAREESLFLCLTLCGTAADRVLEDCRRQGGGLFFAAGGHGMESMLHSLSAHAGHAVSASEASAAAYRLLMNLVGTSAAAPAEGRKLPLVVEAALGIMRREYAFLDGIGELADRLEVTQEYLTRCFCRTIGITPGKYLNRVRIENARILLREGGHSIQFVSDACGFTNSNYFARVFRNSVGMNPRDYARRQRREAAPDAQRENGQIPAPDVPRRDDDLYVL